MSPPQESSCLPSALPHIEAEKTRFVNGFLQNFLAARPRDAAAGRQPWLPLRLQPLQRPAAAAPLVAEAVVDELRLLLPELVPLRDDPVADPELRPRRVLGHR